MPGRLRRLTAAVVLLLLAPLHAAAQVLTVEGVVSPAWFERVGARAPLAPGLALAATDVVLTGPNGRALLRMAEGSAVKVGENARLAVISLGDGERAGQRLVTAALDVARGAFRITTGLFAAPPAGREVTIRVQALTAGIRGTDVWGKSETGRDIVCLIEGGVEVEHRGRRFRMQEPLSFFIAPRAGDPAPVAPVSREQVDLWSAETEIAAGSGGSRRDGRYGVDALTTNDSAAAEEGSARLREAGYPALVETVRSSYGAEEYRVRVGGAASARDAQALADRVRALGYADAAAR